ncbi:helicase associated domain-containing protein [Streptomyces sp. SID3343]|uniref:helicase associated domain-containing protein n=1 Tax=Streptomyces sp. SID3343 TaxID=2690260 RepID=UPI001372092C|nr:helicase associated domain-containing protein [Streptomyces sp. SID3343]MYW04758.1 hypothetical protein [Streptomyces sp. SID3343]
MAPSRSKSIGDGECAYPAARHVLARQDRGVLRGRRARSLALVQPRYPAHRVHGHLEVPRAHMETVVAFDGWPQDVRLGVWVTTTGSRRAKSPAGRIAALDALGMRRTWRCV